MQEEQLGTGHATAQARDALKGFDGLAIVLFGDTPFLRPETLEADLATVTIAASNAVIAVQN